MFKKIISKFNELKFRLTYLHVISLNKKHVDSMLTPGKWYTVNYQICNKGKGELMINNIIIALVKEKGAKKKCGRSNKSLKIKKKQKVS